MQVMAVDGGGRVYISMALPTVGSDGAGRRQVDVSTDCSTARASGSGEVRQLTQANVSTAYSTALAGGYICTCRVSQYSSPHSKYSRSVRQYSSTRIACKAMVQGG